MILARFNSDGTLDPSFEFDGVATADFGDIYDPPLSYGLALTRQIDGKYVAVGDIPFLSAFAAVRIDEAAILAGRIGLTDTEQVVSELAGTVAFTVRRTGGAAGAVSVNYDTAAGRAQPGSDFDTASGTLHWADGDVTDKTIVVTLIDEAEAEHDEDFTLALRDPSGGALLAATSAITTIVSEDGPGELGFSSPHVIISEDVGGLFGRRTGLNVQRSAGSSGQVSVHYRFKAGTTSWVEDFGPAAREGTLTWADGDAKSKTISFDLTDDPWKEGSETFSITLEQPTGGAIIAPGRGIVTVSIEASDLDGKQPPGGGGGFALVELLWLLVLLGAFETTRQSIVRRRRSNGWECAGANDRCWHGFKADPKKR
jgi:hypothetical protein